VQGFLNPLFSSDKTWLTGGSFGLEASAPGLFVLLIICVSFYRYKGVLFPDPVSSE
jgi:hypothetical protein